MIIGIVSLVVCLLIGAGLLVYTFSDEQGPGKGVTGLLGGLFVLLAILSLGFIQIDAGHVGVVTSFGEVHEEELGPGLHYLIPVFNQVTDVDTRVRGLKVTKYTAASKEQQDLFLDMTLNYHVIPDRASDIIKTIGPDFEDKIVKPRLLDIPKSVTDDYSTQIVLNSRDEIREKAVSLLSAAIEQYGFVVDTINLENFSYSAEYNQAIEQKQIEQQKVQTEQQILAQKEIQAQQVKIQAEGQAQATIATAQGQAKANQLLTQSLSPELIQYTAIQKLNPNVNVMLVPEGNGFILDLKDLQQEVNK